MSISADRSIGLFRPAITLFLALSLVTGLLYPFAVTGVAQLAFPSAAQGGLIVREGQVIGSKLIGQSFSAPGHFWSRPSATGPMAYNGAASSGSNLGPTNPALRDAVKARVDALRLADPSNQRPIPVDLVTASASGLDPHISKAAADYQVARVSRATHLNVAQVQQLVDRHTQGVVLGFLGEARVNVLELNVALDDLLTHK